MRFAHGQFHISAAFHLEALAADPHLSPLAVPTIFIRAIQSGFEPE
jgi:hypothetical protein